MSRRGLLRTRPRLHDVSRPAAAVAVAVLLWTTWWAWRTWSVRGISWHFFADGSRLLLHGSGLGVYADHPELQIGPLSLAVAALLTPLPDAMAKTVAIVAMTAAGPLLLAVLAPVVDPARRQIRLLLAAAAFVPAWVVLSVRWGHLDDVLAVVGATIAVRAVCTDRALLAGIALAAATASKPWAIGFLPVLLGLSRDRVRAAAVALAGTAAAWLPFVLADRGTLHALRPPVGLAPASGLHALGVRGRVVPGWGRTVQLLLSPAVALVAGLTGRWRGALLVAVAVRLTLDPQDNAYYIGSAALAAVVFDLLATRSLIPWMTLVTVVALWQPFVRDFPHRFTTTHGLAHWWFANQETVGTLHLGWAVFVVVIVFALPRTSEP